MHISALPGIFRSENQRCNDCASTVPLASGLFFKHSARRTKLGYRDSIEVLRRLPADTIGAYYQKFPQLASRPAWAPGAVKSLQAAIPDSRVAGTLLYSTADGDLE